MRNHLKAVLMGGVTLGTAMIGGCSAVTPGPMQQVQYYCNPGYELRSDRLCWPRSYDPPAASYDPPATYNAPTVVDDPPPAAPAPHGWWDNWGRDAAMTAGAVGGIEAGKYALSKMRGRGGAAVADGSAAAGADAGAVARAVPRVAAPLAAGGRAGAAAVVDGAAAGAGAGAVARAVPRLAAPVADDALITVIERAGVWVMRHPWILLEL